MTFSASQKQRIARSSPVGFATQAIPNYRPYLHLKKLDELLIQAFNEQDAVLAGWRAVAEQQGLAEAEARELCEGGRFDRLIVTMPPRHGKSETISKATPAWFLGTRPHLSVILASYEARFAASWGGKARDLLAEKGPELLGVTVPRPQAANEWRVLGGQGAMHTAGAGGAITGKGAELFVVDDPVKNAEEAQSETIRENHWEWWRSTVRTRLHKGCVVILLMTRWHEDDLAGRLVAAEEELQEEEREGWRVLNLPAVWEPDEELGEAEDPLGREEGEPLCRGLGFDERWARRTRAAVGTYWWTAMYQGRPRPAEGLLFKSKDFRYFTIDEEQRLYVLEHEDGGLHPIGIDWCQHFQTSDTAASEAEMADYTVVSTWAVTPERELLLVNVERERFEDTRVGSFLTMAYNDAAERPVKIAVEDASAGAKAVRELKGAGIPVSPVTPDKDKVTRALLAVARYEQHVVYHLRAAPWRRKFEGELLAFPNAAHDDQVDTVSMAAVELPRIPVKGNRPRRGEGKPKTQFGGLKGKRL
jgi:predicted phage terminase large subunit-like protein